MLTAETKYRLLLQISRKVSGTLDLDEILRHILDTIRDVLPYDAAGIFVLTHEDPFLRVGHPRQVIAGMASRGFPVRPVEDDPMLLSGRGLVGHVIRAGEAVVVADVARDARYVEARRETRSEIAVPIRIDGRPIGALNLESDTLAAYAPTDEAILQFFAEAAAISIEKAILHRQLIEKRHIEDQLQIAHNVQARLLPLAPPTVAGYDLAGVSVPSFDIGGDYFDYLPLAADALGLVVADVSGKGIPAALIMATFRALLRTHARRGLGVLDVVGSVNQLLIESAGLPAFVTAVYGVLEPASGRFTYANCGHNPPMVVRADGAVTELGGGGPFLGVFDGARYEAREVSLCPGDVLVLYTDGVVEAARDESEFGVERLAGLVRGLRGLPASDIVARAVDSTRAFTGSSSYRDDFTLVVVARR